MNKKALIGGALIAFTWLQTLPLAAAAAIEHYVSSSTYSPSWDYRNSRAPRADLFTSSGQTTVHTVIQSTTLSTFDTSLGTLQFAVIDFSQGASSVDLLQRWRSLDTYFPSDVQGSISLDYSVSLHVPGLAGYYTDGISFDYGPISRSCEFSKDLTSGVINTTNTECWSSIDLTFAPRSDFLFFLGSQAEAALFLTGDSFDIQIVLDYTYSWSTTDTDLFLDGENGCVAGALDLFVCTMAGSETFGTLGSGIDAGILVASVDYFYEPFVVTASVPEPEVYAMLGVGLGLMGCVGRRRKLQAA